MAPEMHRAIGPRPTVDKLPICDFCSTPIPPWSIPTRDYTHPDHPELGSRGDFAACEECYELVAFGSHEELLKRSVDTFYERYQREQDKAEVPYLVLKQEIAKIHDAFWKNRAPGAPRRLLSAEATRQLRLHAHQIVTEGGRVNFTLPDEDREAVIRYLNDEFQITTTPFEDVLRPPLARTWQDVLDLQVDLWRWWDTVGGRGYGEGMHDSLAKQRGWVGPVAGIAEAARHSLAAAEPISVGDEVMELVDFAVKTFEPEALYAHDLWTPHGFVVLPHPFHFTDQRGQRLSLSAFHWSPMRAENKNPDPDRSRSVSPESDPEYAQGTYFWLYSDRDDPLDDVSVRIADGVAGPLHATRLHLTHSTGWFYARRPPQEGDEDFSQRDLWTWLQAFFRIGQERVVARTSRRPQRAVRRRAVRAQMEPRNVMVVTLRRAAVEGTPEDSDRQVGVDFQFPVRGHWRHQWYPSLGEHRQKWIAEFVKGQPGTPLRAPLRAFKFTR